MKVDGIINVLKPPGMSSHDVVNFIRRTAKEKKVGHTGTLDPGAAGVLPVCIGKATRLAQFITAGDKSYRAEMTLGICTTSLDAFGDVLTNVDAAHLHLDEIKEAFTRFTGEITQIPPMSSAIKVNGQKLYQLERLGRVVDVPPRRVHIHEIAFVAAWGIGTAHPRVIFDVTCSKGTYIRSLCSDIGHVLNCGAYLSFLLRYQSGKFRLEQAKTLEQISAYAGQDQLDRLVTSMDQVLAEMPVIEARGKAVQAVKSGAVLYPPGITNLPPGLLEGQLVRVRGDGELLAVSKVFLEQTGRMVFKPVVVLAK